MNTAMEARLEAIAHAEKVYDEAIAAAGKAYREARATAWKVYDEALATAEERKQASGETTDG